MRSIPYETRDGLTLRRPVMTQRQAEKVIDSLQGFCMACGKTQEDVEMDARKVACHSCAAQKVYGLPELLAMGLLMVKGS